MITVAPTRTNGLRLFMRLDVDGKIFEAAEDLMTGQQFGGHTFEWWAQYSGQTIDVDEEEKKEANNAK